MNIFTNTLADMNWQDIERHAQKDAIVLLPMGVMEEHGPHLPIATDIYAAHLYCNAIVPLLAQEGHAAVIAPPFYWGICQAASEFVGSFRIRHETAKALLDDMLASLKEFGFTRVFAVNGHGDEEHKMVAIRAFQKACKQLGMTACFPYEDFMQTRYGYKNDAPYFYTIPPTTQKFSQAPIGDTHAGDAETATIHAFYPHLVDTQTAKNLPDIPLGARYDDWMFDGQLKEMSPQGYLGAPAFYDRYNANKSVDDRARRYTDAIITRINRT